MFVFGAGHTLAFMNMLVVMTYNPGLMMAVVSGEGVGMMMYGLYRALSGGSSMSLLGNFTFVLPPSSTTLPLSSHHSHSSLCAALPAAGEMCGVAMFEPLLASVETATEESCH